MTDLQNISSNLLLVGFVLISICCLYLLYSNFSKIRDINDLKRKSQLQQTNKYVESHKTFVKKVLQLQSRNDIYMKRPFPH